MLMITEPVDPSSCVIVESDLCQGLRVLCKIDSHFHPARVEEVSPPDIYGVRVIKDRANHQHIFIRDELLNEAVSHPFLKLFLALSFHIINNKSFKVVTNGLFLLKNV